MKKTIFTGLLALAVVAGACVTVGAASAVRATIQATLSPDVTVKYNGEVQVMKDVNGNAVYPILYNGTTYLPIRAVSDMLGLPVNWVGETRTVELGTVGPKSFLSVTDAGTKTTSGNVSKWVKVLNKDELPGRGDFGEGLAVHSEAIKADSYSALQTTKTKFRLDGAYSVLSFTAYNCSEYTARVQILDGSTSSVLWSAAIGAGESLYVAAVDISRSREVEFAVDLTNVPVGTRGIYDAIYVCDPLVS